MQLFGALSVIILLIVAVLLFTTERGHVPSTEVSSPFVYLFNKSGFLEETGEAANTKSPYWWLNSGGRLEISTSTGSTMLGDAPSNDRWRKAYAVSNPIDTDQGLHPQNLFRLVTRSMWGNARQEVELYVVADNLSQSPNRNASNGLYLMSRYIDGDTLYYAGLRVDGMATIKKKYRGIYYTLAEAAVFHGTYDKNKSPSLLPHNMWISLRVDTYRINGGIIIKLFMKHESDSKWKELVEATDHGQYGTPPIEESGRNGIRTDFMDVEFKSYRMENL